jgi:hypothetical protein
MDLKYQIIDDDCVQETDVFKLMKSLSSYVEEVWKIQITSYWLSTEPDDSVHSDDETVYKYFIVEKGGIAPPLTEKEVIKLYSGEQHDLCSYRASKVSRLYIIADSCGCTISEAVLEMEE